MIFDVAGDMVASVVADELSKLENMTDIAFSKVLGRVDNCLPGIVGLIITDAKNEWRSRASEAGRWGGKYSRAIQSRLSGLEGTVFLDESIKDQSSNKPASMFALMVEGGVRTWSIRDALMRSDKARLSKSGVKYIIIPFGVAVPRKAGSGHKVSAFGGREMTQEIYDIVKNGDESYSGSIMTQNSQGKKNIDITGLSKINTQGRHGQYGYFRCVSENSKGWQYPSVPPEPVFAGVEKYVDRRIKEIMSELCKAIVAEFTTE